MGKMVSARAGLCARVRSVRGCAVREVVLCARWCCARVGAVREVVLSVRH